MASQRFSRRINLLFLAAICFHPSFILSFAQHKAGAVSSGAPPSIYIINEELVNDVRIQIKAGGAVKRSTVVSPGKEFQLRADIVNDVYYAMASYGSEIASFKAYEPERDKAHAKINWKVDGWGFSISYDKVKWEKVAPWETE